MRVLVTGGTGFIGRSVVRRLVEAGFGVRLLLRPGPKSPQLPRGIPLQVALSSLNDRRGIQAALIGVETLVHLAGSEQEGLATNLQRVDVVGTQVLAEAAAQAGVRRLLYLGHLGADRSSAYPVMRAKAMAEGFVRQSGVPHTLLRSAIAFGEGDRFTTALAELLAISPGIFPLIGDGSTRLQPIWVEDLATAIVWALEEPTPQVSPMEIGGPEYFTLREVVEMVMRASGRRRLTVGIAPPLARAGFWAMSRLLPAAPLNAYWVDYLAEGRTASLDSLPRLLGLSPSRMEDKLGYLRQPRWAWKFLQRQLGTAGS